MNADVKKNVAGSSPQAIVIIGAGFGDEGKGLLTDYYAARFGGNCIVARINGGAQAGHTVVTPDGRAHIHSHFGSGTLAGAATFLSRHFVSHPLLFRREAAELEKFGSGLPEVLADERGPVTTPYDMLVNQWAENSRGSRRHGSCGIGFGETVGRCQDARFAVRISDLADPCSLAAIVDRIRREWLPARLKALQIPKLTGAQRDLLRSDKLRDDFIAAAGEYAARVKLRRPSVLKSANVVFEGAQGLLLDADYGWFPHVTRSHTGLKNAVEVGGEAGLSGRLRCVYVTRAYATRHGAGYLPHELPAKPYPGIEDPTNIPNAHQGSLRFGWLDAELLKRTIDRDFQDYAAAAAPSAPATVSALTITRQLAVTCLDQVDKTAFFARGKSLCETPRQNFAASLARLTGITDVYACGGRTRDAITKINLGDE